MALHEATVKSQFVVLVFIFDINILGNIKNKYDRRISLIHQSLVEIDQKLRKKGSVLVVLKGNPIKEIPNFAKRIKADAIFVNRDYEPFAKRRDKAIENACKGLRIAFNSFKDHVIFEGNELLNQSGKPYRVFTPYKNKWLMELNGALYPNHKSYLNRLVPKKQIRGELVDWSLKKMGFESTRLPIKGGQNAAKKQLKRFLPNLINFHKNRDYPSISNGTSHLSVHLRFGTLSIRSLVRAALNNSSFGSKTWLSELIWRDFYQMLLDQFPHVVKGCFKQEYDRIQWPGTQRQFNLWCQGRTGFPLIDAAMQHFNATGWMHNRLRMIVASFLVKDLLVDWRKGEAYFARYLLDFDLAANNGGWQWCASTGCDAQPWFRIFNPVTQSERFDPDGSFIRSVLPELSGFSNKDIHFPFASGLKSQKNASCIVGKDYSKPIVEHAIQRNKFLKIFKNASKL